MAIVLWNSLTVEIDWWQSGGRHKGRKGCKLVSAQQWGRAVWIASYEGGDGFCVVQMLISIFTTSERGP